MREEKREKRRVLLGMSGGVDSSLAAYLLKKEGYEVTGCTMSLYNPDGPQTQENIHDAKSVADALGIPFEVLHLEEAFREKVVSYFVEEYKAGRTPNPCVRCNKTIKFGLFLEEALKRGYDDVATGHYVRLTNVDGRLAIARAGDEKKDQSYFLYGLTQEQLAHVLFPLGDYTKDKVRELAKEWDLPVATKKDSEDVCFIPDGDAMGFLRQRVKTCPGEFVDTKGRVLGRHEGALGYTLGQRRGLGVALGKKMFVKAILPEEERVVLAEDRELYASRLYAKDVNFQGIADLSTPRRAYGKVRSSKVPAAATIVMEGDLLVADFEEPVRAMTPGQAAVFYDEEGRILCGGTIVDKKDA